MENILNLDATASTASHQASGISSGISDAIMLLDYMDKQSQKKENKGCIILKSGLIGKLSKKATNKGYETDVFIDINNVEYPIVKRVFDLKGNELPYKWYVSENTKEKPNLTTEQKETLQKLKVISKWFILDDVVKTTSNMDVIVFKYKNKDFITLDTQTIDFSNLSNMKYDVNTKKYTY